MLQLVRFGTCIHIFATTERRFVKTTAGRVASALGLVRPTRYQEELLSRNIMLQRVSWVKCGGCSLGKKKDREHDHRFAVSDRQGMM